MAQNKPTKPTNLMPTHFADDGVKNNFTSAKIASGFSSNFEDVLQGDNLNYMLDSIGKQLDYLHTVVDYINAIGVKKVPYINSDNKLDSADIDTLLPTQTGNAGTFLTTNGTSASWSSDFRVIGEPIITLNFNYVLPSNCVWLDGTGGTNGNGVVPTTGEWAKLFAIYGWLYDTSYTNTNQFRLPNFNNRVIWGGNSAGYINAGLPNPNLTTASAGAHTHSGSTNVNGDHYHGSMGEHSGQGSLYGFYETANNHLGTKGSLDWDNSIWRTSTNGSHSHNFTTASNGAHTHNIVVGNSVYGNSTTVQPPAIKARVYTRYK